jgi:hypothetical protein
MANTSSTPTRMETATRKPRLELQEQVRGRAYELYEQRGREEGHELDDWLQAESEIESEIVQQRAKTAVA